MHLTMPAKKRLDEKLREWLNLTPELFPFVKAALGKHDSSFFRDLRRELDTWELFVKSTDERRRQWEAARRLLWCAEHVSTISTLDLNELEHALSAMKDETPDFIKEFEEWVGWVWDCSRILRGTHTQEFSANIPIALSGDNNQSLNATGTLARLVLEVFLPIF